MSLLERSHVEPNDAELISRVRGGDNAAYGLLFERHREAASRLARGLSRGGEADDLVSEAFARVLTVLQRGGGPDVSFRAYLLTSVRRVHVDRIRSTRRAVPTDDIETLDSGVDFDDPAVAGFEGSAAARAYASLPERWQLVLWHLEVEGQKPADVAPLLGLSPNSVSVLAYRAREGLRQAFLQEHATDVEDHECEWTRGKLGALVRNGLSKRDSTKVAAHLEGCRPCTAVYLELTEVNSSLGAILGPLVLGPAAAGYAAGAPTAAPDLVAVLGRARDFLVGNSQTALVATAATAVTAVGIGGLVIANQPESTNTNTSADRPAHLKVLPRSRDRTAPARPIGTAPTGPVADQPTPSAHPPTPAPSPTKAARTPEQVVAAPGKPDDSTPGTTTPARPKPAISRRPDQSPGTPGDDSPGASTPASPSSDPRPADLPVLRVGLSVTVLDSPQGDASGRATRSTVQAEVTGLPGSSTTRLEISLEAKVQSLQLPPGCTRAGDLGATCEARNGLLVFHVVHKGTVHVRVAGTAMRGTRVVLPGRA